MIPPRASLLLPLFGGLLLACGDKDDSGLPPGGDADADGLSNGEESALGTDPNNADSDGDGLSDGDEVDQGTDPLSTDTDGDGIDDPDEADHGTDPADADSDDDGLMDGEELTWGTDPLADDSDGDGFLDGDEISAGTNPNYVYSHTYMGGYNVGFCEDGLPGATGPTGRASATIHGSTYTWDYYQVGDVLENFNFLDQHGERVDLYSFCGQIITIVNGAFWWPSCKTEAGQAQSRQDTYADQGYQYIELTTQNAQGSTPTQSNLESWAATYGFTTVPVLAVTGSAAQFPNGYAYQLEKDFYIPTMYHIGRDMTVLAADSGSADPGRYF